MELPVITWRCVGVASLAVAALSTSPASTAQGGSQPARAREVCQATLDDARSARRAGNRTAAREAATVALSRCMDLMPQARGELQGVLDWAQQAPAPAPASEPAANDPDVPLLSRDAGAGTDMLKQRAAPPASPSPSAAAGSGGAEGSAAAGGSCDERLAAVLQAAQGPMQRAPGMNATFHVTATMLQRAIDAVLPCQADPRVAADIAAMRQQREAALKGCRQTAANESVCDRPAY